MENLILQAAILGTMAFRAGKSSTPCQDSKLLDLIGDSNNTDTLRLLDEWSRNWNLSNLSQTY